MVVGENELGDCVGEAMYPILVVGSTHSSASRSGAMVMRAVTTTPSFFLHHRSRYHLGFPGSNWPLIGRGSPPLA